MNSAFNRHPVSVQMELLLGHLTGLPDIGKDEVKPSYLRLLILQAQQKSHLPIDKICRWVGYCYGALMGDELKSTEIFEFTPPEIPCANAVHPITVASIDILQGLRRIIAMHESAIAETVGDQPHVVFNNKIVTAGKLIDNVTASAKYFSVEELSLRLGVIQGYMVSNGFIDVTVERDRTRPIFHKAYKELGIIPPASVKIETQERK